MVSLKNVTIVSVAGTKAEEALEAIKKTQDQIKAAQTLLILPQDMGYKSYNEFVALELWRYINTDFALLVQNDGYVLDGSKWDDEFLKYDYIGAPWPPKMHYTQDWEEVRVGNGGFSLRSQNLLKMPYYLGLKFTDKGTGYWHEDGFLCVHYRKELEDAGIKFAPVELAAKFSRELPVPETTRDTFGFHKYL